MNTTARFYLGLYGLFIAWLLYVSRFWEEGPWFHRQCKRGVSMASYVGRVLWRVVDDPTATPVVRKRREEAKVIQFESRVKERES